MIELYDPTNSCKIIQITEPSYRMKSYSEDKAKENK